MITPPSDIIKEIDSVLINISINPVQNIDSVRHVLSSSKQEILYLRKHIEVISKCRVTSSDMAMLQDKSAELVLMWNKAKNSKTSINNRWVPGKGE